jgi:RND family efflux transporter MFP subunit
MILKKRINLSEQSLRYVKIAACVAAVVLFIGITFRIIAGIHLWRNTEKDAVLKVAVIKADNEPATEELVLPGNVLAWHDSIIYARTNGYVKKWDVDIGAHVKTGDLLAEIESPEIDAQLRQAEADLITAQANNSLAQTTAVRWKKLLVTDSVSKQETDEKIQGAAGTAALVNASKANVDHLRELVSFEKVLAPYDGIITSRTTDIGSLINAGSGTSQRPLFHIAQVSPLRIYVRVPQNYSSRIKPGLVTELYFAEHPGIKFSATLLDTAQAIDPVSRTLLVQFKAENKDDVLLPGGYTEVHLILPTQSGAVLLPVNALLFRAQGLQVATVNNDNKVQLKKITISRDYGDVVEVSTGVDKGDTIILNPSDSIIDGERVNVVSVVKDKVKKP